VSWSSISVISGFDYQPTSKCKSGTGSVNIDRYPSHPASPWCPTNHRTPHSCQLKSASGMDPYSLPTAPAYNQYAISYCTRPVSNHPEPFSSTAYSNHHYLIPQASAPAYESSSYHPHVQARADDGRSVYMPDQAQYSYPVPNDNPISACIPDRISAYPYTYAQAAGTSFQPSQPMATTSMLNPYQPGLLDQNVLFFDQIGHPPPSELHTRTCDRAVAIARRVGCSHKSLQILSRSRRVALGHETRSVSCGSVGSRIPCHLSPKPATQHALLISRSYSVLLGVRIS